MIQNTFNIAGGVARNPLVRLAAPITATISAGEHIAIVGPNGGGKSLFVDTLIGKYPLREGTLQYDFSPAATQTVYDNVKYIAFRDTYGAADANYYYQQRWNAHDQDEAPDVREMLGEIKDEQLKQELFELFRIEPMLDKKIILLSSGELRKFQLVKTLLTAPRVLIMDNPFIGLDAPTRELLFSLLDRLTKMSSVQIILVLSMLDDIPSFITHVIPVDKMMVYSKMEREAYLEAFRSRDAAVSFDELQQRIVNLPYDGNNYDSDEVVKLNKVSIRYDDRTILKDLDWTVRRGEKWALSGENGAGKSTMLNAVAGTWFVDEGKITIDDIDVTKLPEHKRAKYLGRVFQDPMTGTAATMQIEENMALAARRGMTRSLKAGITAKEREFYREQLKILGLGLEDRLTSKVGLLSGGQRQALTLLMATLKKPRLLLLDEHTAALDPKTAAKVLETTDKIVNSEHLTTLMITHNMRDAIAHGNRLIMMNAGHVIYDVAGEEKKHLTVQDLLAKFEEAAGGELANDRMILS